MSDGALVRAAGNGQMARTGENVPERYTQAWIDTVRKGMCAKATEVEFAIFLGLCQRYDLDPNNKEIFWIKYGSTPIIQTARDGYLKICQRDPEFLGCNGMAVHENDEFEVTTDPASGALLIHHRFKLRERGALVGAWARAVHARRQPVVCWAEFSEYDKSKKPGGETWRDYPSAMILKVAESMALKRQGGISGMVTVEEVGEYYEGDPESEPPSRRSRSPGGAEAAQARPAVGSGSGTPSGSEAVGLELKRLSNRLSQVCLGLGAKDRDAAASMVAQATGGPWPTTHEGFDRAFARLEEWRLAAEEKRLQAEAGPPFSEAEGQEMPHSPSRAGAPATAEPDDFGEPDTEDNVSSDDPALDVPEEDGEGIDPFDDGADRVDPETGEVLRAGTAGPSKRDRLMAEIRDLEEALKGREPGFDGRRERGEGGLPKGLDYCNETQLETWRDRLVARSRGGTGGQRQETVIGVPSPLEESRPGDQSDVPGPVGRLYGSVLGEETPAGESGRKNAVDALAQRGGRRR